MRQTVESLSSLTNHFIACISIQPYVQSISWHYEFIHLRYVSSLINPVIPFANCKRENEGLGTNAMSTKLECKNRHICPSGYIGIDGFFYRLIDL